MFVKGRNTRVLRPFFVLFLLGLAGCAAGPVDYPREHSEAIPVSTESTLGRATSEWQRESGAQSGFYPLGAGFDALTARLALMDLAEISIDAQYFLMKNDRAGRIFAAKMLEAADRGVRVRFLLDDIFTTVDDDSLLMLDSHPNIEVRLFNPVARRGLYYFNYLGDFKRANRRMHNKSFIVDNAIGVVGGRNIAAEYFQLEEHGEFADFDMLLAGNITGEVEGSFDRFWNHAYAVPVEAFKDADEQVDYDARRDLLTSLEDEGEAEYQQALQQHSVGQQWQDLSRLIPAEARVVTDDPEKLVHKPAGEYQVLINELTQAMEAAESEVIILTPYLVPGEGAMHVIKGLRERGVRVVIFTNSLASTNHVAVHGAYARYREPLVEAGVELHEIRVNAVPGAGDEKLTLHTKLIIIDRQVSFIGSLNVDPRSVDINTEMGIMVESTEIGQAIATGALTLLRPVSYRVSLVDGDLVWQADIDGETVELSKEPDTSGWRRFKATMSKVVPESQL